MENRPPSESIARHDALISVLILLLTFLIYWFSPVRQITDSNYSMLLSESLLHHHSFMLDSYMIPRFTPQWHDNTFKNGEMYQIELVGPHLYYYLPPGSSVLSVPYVACLNAFGISAANADGTYNGEGEARIQKGLAALLCAGLAYVLYLTARLLLPIGWSVIIAVGAALGTQMWSTASRGLWSDTWAILLLGLALYILVADACGKQKLKPVLLATLLSWTYFVRPTNSISIAAITIYLLLYRRQQIKKFVLTGLFWLLGFAAYSWYQFHQLLPNYFLPGRLSFGSFGTAFAGNLVSPSRGLFIFVPVLWFVAYLLITYRKQIFSTKLALVALPVILFHLVAIGGFTPWNGGFCYGPRYTTGLVPWFALLAIVGVSALRKTREARRRRMVSLIGAVLLAVSILINAHGATSYEAWMWNQWPDNVDQVPQKIWDWRRPQFLAGIVRPPLREPIPVLTGRIEFGSAEADRFLWYGWSWSEQSFRWTDGREAAFTFALNSIRAGKLVIKMGAFVAPGKLDDQHVEIVLNDNLLRAIDMREEATSEFEFPLAENLLRARNTLIFKIPKATSPKALNVSSDERRLGIRIEWLELQPADK